MLFLSWYPWILCQVSVYVVGRVWHQPNFALAASACRQAWIGAAAAARYARCTSACSAGIVHERCYARARRFLLFYSHLFETGIWVGRAEKGHDGNAEKRHGKLLPWKVTFLKGITAMAEGIDGNCRRCRRVISGLNTHHYFKTNHTSVSFSRQFSCVTTSVDENWPARTYSAAHIPMATHIFWFNLAFGTQSSALHIWLVLGWHHSTKNSWVLIGPTTTTTSRLERRRSSNTLDVAALQ